MIDSAYGIASRIDSKHWQGGFPSYKEWSVLKQKGVDVLVLCAKEYQPSSPEESAAIFPGVITICAPMDDAVLTEEEAKAAVRAARLVVVRHLNEERRVLVTCQAGRNRSGLVSALALVMRRKMSGKEAVMVVKGCRPNALTNGTFVTWLETLKQGLPVDTGTLPR